MKTKYRTINNGYYDILQYQVKSPPKWWQFSSKLEWEYVPRPFFHKVYGRASYLPGIEAIVNISSFKDNLEEFVAKYPNINEYWSVFDKEQAALEAKAAEQDQEITTNKLKVRYF